jgi:hypothetical protein
MSYTSPDRESSGFLGATDHGRSLIEDGYFDAPTVALKFADSSITSAKLAAGAVGASDLAAGALAATTAGRAITASGYFDSTTVADKFASGCFAADTTGRSLLATGYFDAATVTDKFAAGSIAWDRSAPGLAAGSIRSWNGTAWTDSNSAWALGSAVTPAVYLRNSTAAADGSQQSSPAIVLEGQGWKTTATAASMPVAWKIRARPVQSTSAPYSVLEFMFSINGAADTTSMYLQSTGGAGASSLVFSGTVISATSATATLGALQAARSGVSADSGALGAGYVTFVNATAAKNSTPATLGNAPTGIAAENAAWLKLYVGTTTAYIPYWTA